MKALCTILLACLCFSKVSAQVHFGAGLPDANIQMPEFRDVLLSRGLTLLFVVPESELDQLESYKTAFTDNWSWSPFQVLAADEVEQLGPGRYATLFPTIRKVPSGLPFYELSYTYSKPSGNGAKPQLIKVAGIMLTHEHDAQDLDEYDQRLPLEEISTMESWHKGRYVNMSPSWLALQLSDLQQQLEASEVFGVLEDRFVGNSLKVLQTDTLYIPEIALTGSYHSEPELITSRASSIFELYPYPWKVISSNETAKKIEDRKGMLFTRFRIGDKAVYQIYDLDSRAVIFSKKLSFYSGLKKKQLLKLAEEIAAQP